MAACAAFKLRPKIGSGRSAHGILLHAASPLLYLGGIPRNARMGSSLACRQPVEWKADQIRTPRCFMGMKRLTTVVLAFIDIEVFECLELVDCGGHLAYGHIRHICEGSTGVVVVRHEPAGVEYKQVHSHTTSSNFPFFPCQAFGVSMKAKPPRPRTVTKGAACTDVEC